MSEAGDFEALLVARRTVETPVAVVVAHPDDETIGAGASLRLFADLLLVHVTDGAPRSLADARAAGFADAAGYARARRDELAAALEAGRALARTVCLAVADQAASGVMAEVAERMASLFAEHGTAVVLTHAYEGGHPDHDATAFAVHAACRSMGARAPAVVEMTGYHAGPDGSMETGRFLSSAGVTAVGLDGAEQALKRRMLECFVSQAGTLAPFGVETETFRRAPRYDFTLPPHEGALHYERFDWGMDGPRWRSLVPA